MKRTRGYIIAVHCLCWLIFLSLPALFVAGLSGDIKFPQLLVSSGWLYFTIYIVAFYLHTNFLFPKLYFKRKYILYGLGVLALLAAVYYLRPFDRLAHMEKHPEEHARRNNLERNEGRIPPPEFLHTDDKTQNMPFPVPNRNKRRFGGPKLDIISIVLFLMIIALSITMVIIKRWRIAVEKASVAEAEKVSAELTMLKAQINPHFLFNTLNNIYSQAITRDENTAESIMKLSNIMRYITDDATENFVSLISETNFISDYIELQRLRLGSKVSLDFTINGRLGDKTIAPLILITFIENVFKYGISNSEPSNITIGLKADDHNINFFCRNKLFPLKHQSEGTRIGISNTRKRLDHLYHDKHILNIREEDGFFSVYLVLQS